MYAVLYIGILQVDRQRDQKPEVGESIKSTRAFPL
jgi:hypothetical protein